MSDKANDISRAIQQAQQRYDDLAEELKQYEKIKSEMSQLEVFIKAGKVILGVENKTEGKHEINKPAELFPNENIQPETHLQSIKKILATAQQELSLADLEEEYRKRGWKLSEPNGREVLRGVVLRNHKHFTKTFHGNVAYYGLAA